jgi:fructose-1,6-bisphosphatase/inositol monophosphatase family enzyme
MWVVDPIDGTDNYIAEIPVWATLIALIIDGDIVLGVAHAPALDETYEAARGMGTCMNSYPISVDEVNFGHATVLDSGLEWLTAHGLATFYSELVGRARRAREFRRLLGPNARSARCGSREGRAGAPDLGLRRAAADSGGGVAGSHSSTAPR